jgi:type II secretory pathway component PulF
VTVIEPALLIIMGIVIAVIVLALYLPLFELTNVIGTS